MILQACKSIELEFKEKKYYLNICSHMEPITLYPQNVNEMYQIDDSIEDRPYFVVYVTDFCNMKCKYCFNSMSKDIESNNKMPLYSAKDFSSFIHRNYFDKEIGVRFFGGEPLLNKQWIYDFVREMKRENIKASYDIFTNVSLLDEEFIDFAEKYQFRFYLSVNGGDDEYKGTRYKEEIWKKIRNLMDRGFHVIARMVWIPNKEESLIDLVTQVVENRVKTVSVTLPWGREFDGEIFSSQLDEFAEFYVRNILHHNYRYIGVAPFVSYIMKWTDGEALNSIFCDAGKSMVSIATDGNCYPCHCFTNIKEYCAGNIFKTVKPLFSDMNADTMAPCKSCAVRYFCKAKCAADGFFANGNPYIMNDKKCKTEYKIIGASAYILYELQQNKCEYMAFRKLLAKVRKYYNNS